MKDERGIELKLSFDLRRGETILRLLGSAALCQRRKVEDEETKAMTHKEERNGETVVARRAAFCRAEKKSRR